MQLLAAIPLPARHPLEPPSKVESQVRNFTCILILILIAIGIGADAGDAFIFLLVIHVGVHKLVRGRGGEVEEERVASEYRIVPSCATISKKSLCMLYY